MGGHTDIQTVFCASCYCQCCALVLQHMRLCTFYWMVIEAHPAHAPPLRTWVPVPTFVYCVSPATHLYYFHHNHMIRKADVLHLVIVVV